MAFLEEIEQHNDRLNAFEKNKTFSGDVNKLRDLVRIYNEYVYQGKGDVKGCAGCGDQTAKMMQRILTHRDEQLQKHEGIPVEAKLIEEIEVDFPLSGATTVQGASVTLDDMEIALTKIQETGEYFVKFEKDPEDMKWGELRKYATSKGMNITGKKKKDILKWLKENS